MNIYPSAYAPDQERRALIRWLVLLAAGLSFLAGLIHFWVAPEHFEEWWGYGIFFIVVGLAQVIFALALLRWPRRLAQFPRRWILALGIAANLAVVAFYILTRTVGVPLGPEAGEVEGVGTIDLAAKTAELLLVAVLVALTALRGQFFRTSL